jgi:hypothetical protein
LRSGTGWKIGPNAGSAAQLARFQPFPEETYRLRAALREDPEQTRQFFLARQGMISRELFFSPANLQRLMRIGRGSVVSPTGAREQ